MGGGPPQYRRHHHQQEGNSFHAYDLIVEENKDYGEVVYGGADGEGEAEWNPKDFEAGVKSMARTTTVRNTMAREWRDGKWGFGGVG